MPPCVDLIGCSHTSVDLIITRIFDCCHCILLLLFLLFFRSSLLTKDPTRGKHQSALIMMRTTERLGVLARLPLMVVVAVVLTSFESSHAFQPLNVATVQQRHVFLPNNDHFHNTRSTALGAEGNDPKPSDVSFIFLGPT